MGIRRNIGSKVRIRRHPRNTDYYEVLGGGHKPVIVATKESANEVAQARKRLQEKKLKKGVTI